MLEIKTYDLAEIGRLRDQYCDDPQVSEMLLILELKEREIQHLRRTIRDLAQPVGV